jgi:hypothetical protein
VASKVEAEPKGNDHVKIFYPDALAWLSRATGIAQHQIENRAAGGRNVFVAVPGARRTGQGRRFVLRLFNRHEWLAEEPDLVPYEAAALHEARRTSLATPELVAFAAEDVGFGAPVVLMSHLPGRVDLRPADVRAWLRALAQPLAQLHQHTAQDFAWHYSVG